MAALYKFFETVFHAAIADMIPNVLSNITNDTTSGQDSVFIVHKKTLSNIINELMEMPMIIQFILFFLFFFTVAVSFVFYS